MNNQAKEQKYRVDVEALNRFAQKKGIPLEKDITDVFDSILPFIVKAYEAGREGLPLDEKISFVEAVS